MMKKRVSRSLAAVLCLVLALSLFVPALAATPMGGEAVAETPVDDHVHADGLISVGGAVTETPAVAEEEPAGLLDLHVKTFADGATDASGFFTISGNTANNKGTKTYDGVTYSVCLKIETSTAISFTADEAATLTLVLGDASKRVTVDSTDYTSDTDGVITVSLAVGAHTVAKKDSTNLFYMSYGTSHTHTWVLDAANSVAATCTTAGKNVYTCTAEGCTVKTKEEYVEALGHSLITTAAAVAATCTTAGSTAAKACSRCDYTEAATTVPALGHVFEAGSDTCARGCGTRKSDYTWTKQSETAATCTAAGKIVWAANEDSSITYVETSAALGHVDANSDDVCDRCGATMGSTFRVAAGDLETAYAEWTIGTGVTRYEVFVKKSSEADSAYVQLDDTLIRQYSGYMRADALGLAAGTYKMKVVPYIGTAAQTALVTADLTVQAHDRSGFGFVNGTSSGAYNDDGTLKSNAKVVYVTTDAELAALLNSSSIWSGKSETAPTAVRIIGHVQADDVLGFQDWSCGLTVEGVGKDAVLTGGGVFVKGSSNVEVRNLAVFHVHSGGKNDLIAVEQTNDHVWVHNNDLFYGFSGGGDQAKGDGSLDVKDAEYCSFSFNHFWDSGKSSLLGNNSTENYITYHHNWFDHSDSRHPRTRSGNVHVYNNYYDGNAKYGVGCTSGKGGSGKTSIFVEGNYFRNTKYPMLNSKQASDSDGSGGTNTFSSDEPGFIKAWNNTIVGAKSFVSQNDDPSSFDAYVVNSRSETIPSTVTVTGSSSTQTYSNFDTTIDLGVTADEIESPANAVVTVTTWAGRVQGGDIWYDFNDDVEDENYSVIEELDDMLTNYQSGVLAIGGTVSDDASSGSTETCTHPTLAWKITKTPGCDAATQALVDGEETQYCTSCGEVIATRTIAGQHSNDGSGVCTVCGYTTGNGGGTVSSGVGHTLKYSDFTNEGDKVALTQAELTSLYPVSSEDASPYFTLYGSVNKRTKSDGSAMTSLQLAKDGGGGFEFTTSTNATVTVSFSGVNSSIGSGLNIIDVGENESTYGDVMATQDGVATPTSSNSKDTVTVTYALPAGTYRVVSAPYSSSVTMDTRIYTLSVVENEAISTCTHDWSAWTVTTPATCGDDGVETRTCSLCGKTETRDIDATGEHVWSDWVLGAEDEETRTCSVCNEVETRSASYLHGATTDLHYTVSNGAVTVTDTIPTGGLVLATYWKDGQFLGAKAATTNKATDPIDGWDSVKLFWIDQTTAKPQSPAKTIQ